MIHRITRISVIIGHFYKEFKIGAEDNPVILILQF